MSEDETYQDAVESGTVTELPAQDVAFAVAPPWRQRCTAYDQILHDLDARTRPGRGADHNPPGTPGTPAPRTPT